MNEWNNIQLRDACDSVDYGMTASASSEDTGTRFLRITDIVSSSFSWSTVPFVATTEEQVERYRIRPGDIVIARTGASTGASAWIRNTPDNAVFASYLIRLKISEAYDSRFISYVLKSDQYWAYVQGVLGDKSAQPNASATTLVAAPLSVPRTLAQQRTIAAMLGALDDKIAVNERIATTTRELGMVLFEAAVEIGKATIPVEKLAVHLNRGQAPKYTDTQDGVIVLNQKCVRNGRVNVDPARKTEAARVHAERRLATGDVLVNSTGVGTLGRVGIWSHDLSATVDSHVTIVRINPNIVLPIIGAFAMLSAQQTIETMGEGSTGQTELSRAKLGRIEIDIPFGNHEVLAKKLTALEAKSYNALQESRILAALRDTLLPQLMSGKLRVRDVERIVEDSL